MIWLDAAFAYLDTSLNARIRCNPITPALITVADVDECWEYVLKTEVDYLFVIITDKSLVSQASSFVQITFLYVLVPPSQSSTTDNLKVRGIFQSENDLLRKLAEDVDLLRKTTKFNLFKQDKSSKNISRESIKVVWYQYLLEILLTVPEPDVAKQEMINFCQSCYAENGPELSKISEFEKDYCSKNAIKWYTRASFLYRLVNEALRSEDVGFMYAFRFILRDLNTQLTELHSNYLQTLLELQLIPYTLTVYRGQLMSIQELDQIKRNVLGFISMNSFLSTSSNRNVALLFSGLGGQRPHLESVLFEIVIETSTCQSAFAEIHTVSWMSTDEDEILLTFGTIFQIESVNENDDHVWIIRLVLCNRDWKEIPRMQDLFPEWPVWHLPVDLVTLAWCLSEMGDFKRAEDIYKRLARTSSSTEVPIFLSNIAAISFEYQGTANTIEMLAPYQKVLDDMPDLHKCSRIQILLNMATCVLSHGSFEKAQIYVEQSRELLCLDSGEPKEPVAVYCLARFYTISGLLNDQRDQYQEALNFFEQALKVFAAHLSEDNANCGQIALYMGTAEFKINNYLKAIFHYQNALNIFSKLYPSEHSVIANCHHLIGSAYFHDGQTIKAEKSLELALRLRLRNDAVHPEDMAASYYCFGQLCNRSNNHREALAHFGKTYNIYQSCLPKDHIKFVYLFTDMGLAYENIGNFQLGLDYLNKALCIELKRNAESKSLGRIYRNMAGILSKDGKFSESLEYLEKALAVLESNRPSTNEIIASVLNEMGCVYRQLGDYRLALTKYRITYDMTQTPELTAIVAGNIGAVLIELELYNEAVIYLEKELKLRREYLSDQSSSLITCYINLGNAYREMKDHSTAFTYLAQALQNTSEGPEVERTADIFDSIAGVWKDQEKYDEALSSYQTALDISAKCLRADHPTLALRLNNIAAIYNSMKEYEKAVPLLDRALDVFEHSLPSGHPHIVACINNLIHACFELKNYDAVEKYLDKRLIIAQEFDKEKDSICSKIYQNFARIRSTQGRFNEELDYLDKVEAFCLTHDNLGLVMAFFQKGSANYNLAQYGMALKYYERALALTFSVYPSKLILIDRIRYAIDRVLDHIFSLL